MESLVRREFFNAPFFRALAQGDYDASQLRHFALQYGHYSRNFPRILGAAISAMEPLSEWWVPLADNLWDEAGRGSSSRSHQALYQTFLSSIDPCLGGDLHPVPDAPMGSAVAEAVDTFLSFFRRATPMEAMAAVGLGSEFFAGQVMGRIGEGLRHPHYNASRPLNLGFWTIHAEHDEPRHYALCRQVLIRYTRPQDLEVLWNVGSSVARSEAKMYQDLYQEMIDKGSLTGRGDDLR